MLKRPMTNALAETLLRAILTLTLFVCVPKHQLFMTSNLIFKHVPRNKSVKYECFLLFLTHKGIMKLP